MLAPCYLCGLEGLGGVGAGKRLFVSQLARALGPGTVGLKQSQTFLGAKKRQKKVNDNIKKTRKNHRTCRLRSSACCSRGVWYRVGGMGLVFGAGSGSGSGAKALHTTERKEERKKEEKKKEEKKKRRKEENDANIHDRLSHGPG